jgi:hypothetical protein
MSKLQPPRRVSAQHAGVRAPRCVFITFGGPAGRTGSPNAKSLPDWPAYTSEKRATMLFDVNSRVVEDPNAEVRNIVQS